MLTPDLPVLIGKATTSYKGLIIIGVAIVVIIALRVLLTVHEKKRRTKR